MDDFSPSYQKASNKHLQWKSRRNCKLNAWTWSQKISLQIFKKFPNHDSIIKAFLNLSLSQFKPYTRKASLNGEASLRANVNTALRLKSVDDRPSYAKRGGGAGGGFRQNANFTRAIVTSLLVDKWARKYGYVTRRRRCGCRRVKNMKIYTGNKFMIPRNFGGKNRNDRECFSELSLAWPCRCGSEGSRGSGFGGEFYTLAFRGNQPISARTHVFFSSMTGEGVSAPRRSRLSFYPCFYIT